MKRSPVIAVIYPGTVPWMAETLRGIKSYADQHGGWTLVTSPPSLQSTGEETIHIPALRTWKGNGVITVLTSSREEALASKLSIPVINLSGWHAPSSKSLPRVNADHRAMGRMAADHFISAGLRHIAYYGFKQVWFSQERAAGLAERAVEMKCTFEQFLHAMSQRRVSWQEQRNSLRTWLKKLPKPVGILCVQDYRARIILELCEELALNVPDEVSVLGIDNDQMTCEYCTPSLSSISRDPFACGLAAAELLDHLMLKRRPPKQPILVPPGGVIQRQSTCRLYDADPLIREAISFVQNNLQHAFSIRDISSHIKLSRRTLETRFRNKLGVTPHAYILQQRVTLAKSLLLQTNIYRSLGEIAYACGFNTVKAFRLAFKAQTGLTPALYRKQYG